MRTTTPVEHVPACFTPGERRKIHLSLALTLAFVLTSAPAPAQGAERSGREVVDAVCAACHATGAEGAPKIGDTQAWSERASQGLSSLTRHAIAGIRRMPHHGGRPDLSDLEIARAITHMVNRSGGLWIEPASAEDLARERSGEQIVKAQCIKCHGEGLEGAPKIGHRDAWVQRLKMGLGALVHSAIRGHGGMPPRGGLANLTDAELQSAILYMFNPAGAPARPKPAATRAEPDADMDSLHRLVRGLEIHLGFIPAENLRALPRGSPERAMHGGIPEGPGYYHVNVSLYDTAWQAPVDDAKVELVIAEPGLSRTTTALQPMAIGGGSYGTYTRPDPGTRYLITLRIDRPGATETLEAKFTHRFE
ncbi:MAG TPA: c-type cytochrome [Gammaproteobacteria bacterium]|nr:c-type cytochrome [Gammaproteobacteria bacterium]